MPDIGWTEDGRKFIKRIRSAPPELERCFYIAFLGTDEEYTAMLAGVSDTRRDYLQQIRTIKKKPAEGVNV